MLFAGKTVTDLKVGLETQCRNRDCCWDIRPMGMRLQYHFGICGFELPPELGRIHRELKLSSRDSRKDFSAQCCLKNRFLKALL